MVSYEGRENLVSVTMTSLIAGTHLFTGWMTEREGVERREEEYIT